MFRCLQIMCAKYYELRYVLKKLYLAKVATFVWYSVKIRIIFGEEFERRKVDKKQPTWMKHANSILEYFEHFCQMSSKHQIARLCNWSL